MEGREFHIGAFDLEAGGQFPALHLHYSISGDLERQPVVWVFHALTANDDPTQWWPGLFGPEGHYGTGYAVICANVIGSPYGSTCPTSYGGVPYKFPLVTVRDTMRAQLALAAHLGIEHIHTLIGGSFGGYQALEFAYTYTGQVDHLILLATGAEEKPWNKAIHEAQRLAIEADQSYETGDGSLGLKAARGIGMLNYRTSEQFNVSQADSIDDLNNFKAPSYIRYQGQKLVDRFDAASYYALTQQLDSHQLGRGRGGISAALSSISVKTLVLGIDSDVLIPVSVQKELVNHLPDSRYEELKSTFGHDVFLLEYKQITNHILSFYND